MRRLLGAVTIAGLVAVALSACSAAPDTDCVVDPGAASELVSVSGAFDTKPDVDFPTPLKTSTTQRSTVITGDGAPLAEGQMVVVKDSLYNGTTGNLITQSGYGDDKNDDGTVLTLNENLLPGLEKALQCVTVGSRVAIALAPKDAFGATGGSPQLGIKADDTLVAVFDVTKAFLPKANGAPRPAQPGFPSVVTAPNGRPGITIPDNHRPPASLSVETLKQGNGPVVEADKPVTLHYTGVLWKDRSVFESTWEQKQPVTVLDQDQSTISDTSKQGLVKGLAKALEGKHVGSQIVVVVPPKDGYGSKGTTSTTASVPADATLVYVVDILGLGA